MMRIADRRDELCTADIDQGVMVVLLANNGVTRSPSGAAIDLAADYRDRFGASALRQACQRLGAIASGDGDLETMVEAVWLLLGDEEMRAGGQF